MEGQRVPKVLYIAGWGRSGTTVVDNILNEYPAVFSAGELTYLWLRGLVQRRKCGCGVPLPECPLWQAVLTAAFGQDVPDPRTLDRMQQEVARARHTPRLAAGRLHGKAGEYQRTMSRVYNAIAEVTGAGLIVDSSKLPADAAILARMEGVQPYLVHMVRDPRAVAYSWMRPTPQLDEARPRMMKRHGARDSTSRWLVWNALIEYVALGFKDRYVRLRYEDFVAAPRTSVERLLEFTGMPTTDGPFLDELTVKLGGNHTVSGNPNRFRAGDVSISPDERWRTEQPRGPRLTATALALPLLRRYGYRLATRAGRATG